MNWKEELLNKIDAYIETCSNGSWHPGKFWDFMNDIRNTVATHVDKGKEES